MKATCLKDPSHKEFVTVAHVTEDWIVDEEGHFIDVAPNSGSVTTRLPDPGNIWTCATCGAPATVTVT